MKTSLLRSIQVVLTLHQFIPTMEGCTTLYKSLSSCPDPPSEPALPLLDSLSLFTTSLPEHLQSASPEGWLVSPLSIWMSLSLVHLGVAGRSKKSWDQALGYTEDQTESYMERDLRPLVTAVTSGNSSNTSLSTALFLDSGLSVEEAFRQDGKCYHQAHIQTLQLSQEPKQSTDEINGWVSKSTNNKIEKLIPDGSIDSNSQLVLVNTLLFKATWRLPFNEYATQSDQEFTRLDGSKILVDLMVLESTVNYLKTEDGVEIVELEYDGDLVMYIFTNKNEKDDNKISWNGSGLEFSKEALRLEIPKFQLRHTESLVPVLSELGFQMAGDFSGISKQNPQITDILHQTYLRVDEEGSEGAAATGIIMGRMIFIPSVRMRVDHSFFLSVVHKPTKTVLLMGNIDNPGTI